VVLSQKLDRKFSSLFLISFLSHIAFFIITFAVTKYLPQFFESSDVEIIRSSVRVDVVGMPKFTIKELKEMQANPQILTQTNSGKEIKEESRKEEQDIIKKDDLVLIEKSKKKASFLNLLSSYSDKPVGDKNNKKRMEKGRGTTNMDSLIIEGNKISMGSSLVGEHSDQVDSAFSSYVQALPGMIRPFWKLPSYLLDRPLRCRIKIYLSTDGKVLKILIHESSGVPEFDARAEQSIRTATFPRPQPEVASRLVQSGIILGFPL
jgi:colicin import membrane protein